MIKVLLDTNIFIYLEDNKVLEDKVLQLTKRLFDSDEYKIVIHPRTKEEIEKMKDSNQKKIFKSKIAIYKQIINPPVADQSFHKLVGCKNSHDEIDNDLLFSIKRNCVSYLITNDFELKKKSSKVGLNDRVLLIDEALDLFKPISEPKVKKPPFIEEKFLYQLDINDSFFDSLKEDYSDFEKWFENKQKQGEKAFVTIEDNKITSFLMLKEEDETEKYESFEKKLSPLKRLKVSTMKVANTGKRIGETFIKIMIQKAISINVSEIYITVFDKQKHLIDLLEQYGFKYYCKKNQKTATDQIEKENVFIKKTIPIEEYYPFIKLKGKKIFIIPIQEKYHKILFPESEQYFQISLDDLKGLNTSSNSLKKAYLCDSNIKQIIPGSIILFYCSGTKKAITSLGVVDAVFNKFESFNEMYDLVKKRTVYSEDMLKNNYKADKLVILFKHYYSFNKYVTFDFLISQGIINGYIQTIMQITEEDLLKIFDESKFEKEKYLIK